MLMFSESNLLMGVNAICALFVMSFMCFVYPFVSYLSPSILASFAYGMLFPSMVTGCNLLIVIDSNVNFCVCFNFPFIFVIIDIFLFFFIFSLLTCLLIYLHM